jgi:hypothetical protein
MGRIEHFCTWPPIDTYARHGAHYYECEGGGKITIRNGTRVFARLLVAEGEKACRS